jgi:hypothetical protein
MSDPATLSRRAATKAPIIPSAQDIQAAAVAVVGNSSKQLEKIPAVSRFRGILRRRGWRAPSARGDGRRAVASGLSLAMDMEEG